MTDDIDRAQESEQKDRELALRLARERIEASFVPREKGVDGVCIDCGYDIEPERLDALARKTSRCAQCAKDFEHRMRGYR